MVACYEGVSNKCTDSWSFSLICTVHLLWNLIVQTMVSVCVCVHVYVGNLPPTVMVYGNMPVMSTSIA